MVDLLRSIVQLSQKAGHEILDIYRNDHIIVTQKDNDSPVTQADMLAHEIICKALAKLTPEIPIISEESVTQKQHQKRKHWSRYWLIDPIDGTKGFIKKNDHFTVNIGLIENHQPILGVVFAPALDELFYAKKNGGAFKIQDERTSTIQTYLQETPNIWKILLSGDHPSPEIKSKLAILGNYEISSMSSSLKMCRVAEGAAHLYPRLRPTQEWDTAAAHCIINESGASMIMINDQEELRYNTSTSMVNPYFIAAPKTLLPVVVSWIITQSLPSLHS